MKQIGDALLAECGPPPEDGVKDGTNEKIAVVEELQNLKLQDYSVLTLRNIRLVSFKFRKGSRRESLSFSVHQDAGSPEMLETIVKSVGSKPVTREVVRSMRPVIEEHQEREYRKEDTWKPLPKRGC
jgi:hypothetical protein